MSEGYLFLTRKAGREIGSRVYIDIPPSSETQTVEVFVGKVSGNQVSLGFSADKSISIQRDDIKQGKK